MADVTDAHGETLNVSDAGDVSQYGFEIHTNKAITLKYITKHSSDTSVRAILLNAAGDTQLSVVAFVGDVATFNYELADGTTYNLLAGPISPGTHTLRQNTSASFPYNRTNINFVRRVHSAFSTGFVTGGGTASLMTIVSITSEEIVAGTNAQINIGDAWKEVPAMQINIGDTWKEVASAQINIGDAWKTIF